MQTEPIGFKGTPGEWVAHPIFNGGGIVGYAIYSPNGEVVCRINLPICRINLPKYRNEPREESGYDFVLIQSVKKMAIALQEFVEWAEKMDMWDKVGESYYHAKVALKKAGLE